MSDAHDVVLYDGVCGFCNRSVRFIIKRDRKKRFQFAALQSGVGKELAAKHGVDGERLEGLVLIENGEATIKSTAALRIVRRLKWPWPVLALLLALPVRIRDWFYDQFATRRYRWFGKSETCSVPARSDRDRFLDV
jgi:predicted DCC family thiol-disulfide oxidoreductase YuxK